MQPVVAPLYRITTFDKSSLDSRRLPHVDGSRGRIRLNVFETVTLTVYVPARRTCGGRSGLMSSGVAEIPIEPVDGASKL